MRHQVGTTAEFTITGVPAGNYAYVWDWWDRTTSATAIPYTTKKLNMGGDPHDGNLLRFTVTIVAEDGQSQVRSGSLEVNNPPSIASSPSISRNDDFFPFTSVIQIRAYDVENEQISFFWYDAEDVPLGGGTSGTLGLINGTYNGTVAQYNGTLNVFTHVVEETQTIYAKLVDTAGGTTTVDFSLRGGVPPPPAITASTEVNTLTADATTLPDHRIGTGRSVSFVVFSSDVVNTLDFLWSFYGTNGWASNSFSTGVTEVLAGNSLKNSVVKSIENETGGPKRAIVTVNNSTSGKSVDVPVDVFLVANTVAEDMTFKVYRQTIATEIELDLSASDAHPVPDTVAADAKVRYVATAVDPQGDIVTYRWQFLQPTGVLPSSLILWGRSVMVDTVGYPAGGAVQGVVTATDRFGGQVQSNIPAVIIQ